MGTLIYGQPGTSYTFDDRTLAHLQLVIGAKLRRTESFYFSWTEPAGDGESRRSIWLATQIPLVFQYETNDRPVISHEWLEALSSSANSTPGLFLAKEP